MRVLVNDDDFAALVVAAVRAHAMRELDLAAVRARAARGSVHAIMDAATGMGASTTLFLLRYCHHFLLLHKTSLRSIYLCETRKAVW